MFELVVWFLSASSIHKKLKYSCWNSDGIGSPEDKLSPQETPHPFLRPLGEQLISFQLHENFMHENCSSKNTLKAWHELSLRNLVFFQSQNNQKTDGGGGMGGVLESKTGGGEVAS